MKHLTALLTLLLVCFWFQTVQAQAADPWVEVPLAGEGFTIRLPKSKVVKSHNTSFEQFKVEGSVYTATEDGVDYAAWSLVDQNYSSQSPPSSESYLDACADLVWESLLKPLRDELPKKPEVPSFMAYQRTLETVRQQRGREYAITLGNRTGLAHFYVAGPHIYVLTVLNPQANFAATQRFLNFVVSKTPTLPVAATIAVDPKLISPPVTAVADPRLVRTGRGGGIGPGEGGGIGPGRGGNVGGGDQKAVGGAPSTTAGDIDYNKIFSGKDVTQKARILSKPEPSYTESARKYSVTGTVVLRAVFSSSGQVTQIRVSHGLPHGLTAKAVDAAKGIKFIPAQKDGHDVSMYFQLEYNFTLY